MIRAQPNPTEPSVAFDSIVVRTLHRERERERRGRGKLPASSLILISIHESITFVIGNDWLGGLESEIENEKQQGQEEKQEKKSNLSPPPPLFFWWGGRV
jgi:hypothetical protein